MDFVLRIIWKSGWCWYDQMEFVEITNTTVLYLILLDNISELDLLFELNIFQTLIRQSQTLLNFQMLTPWASKSFDPWEVTNWF